MIYHLSSDGVTTREMEMGSPNMISFGKKNHQSAVLVTRMPGSSIDGTPATQTERTERARLWRWRHDPRSGTE